MFKFWKSGGAKEREDIAVDDRSWQFLVADIHAHILPGLDDGAQNMDQSMALIEEMIQRGFEHIVATPHINEDIYRNNSTTIGEALQKVREEISRRGLPLKVDAAAEYMIDAGFMKIVKEEPLLTVYENKVLVEMSYIQESRFLFEGLFQMQAKGYKPILAHPERYVYYHNRLKQYEELKEKGCYLQLNTIALSGYYGKEVKKTAEQLLDAGLYDFCGSDIHHTRHTDAMKQVLQGNFYGKLADYGFLNNTIIVK